MDQLCYQILENQNYQGYLLKDAPERVLQFGEGNFLRAFVDYFIDMMNEKAGFHSKVVLCQPISSGLANQINQQEGLYTLLLRGYENGTQINDKRIISCVSRCINPYEDFSLLMDCAKNPDLRFITCNTTEAGIVYDPSCLFSHQPAASFPGKLTQLLYQRFLEFGNEAGKGFVILSCELIDDNGKELEKCVLKYAKQWELPSEFIEWIQSENIFCSTLVDRIVTGYPSLEAEELWQTMGYEDHLIDTSEIFGFWVIEGPESLKQELPFHHANLPVLITNNHKPYKQRKVRILNGAHTSFVLGAYLSGQNIVRSCMEDSVISNFMNHTIYDEIIPTLTLPEKELNSFASAVSDRFNNPFIDHSLLAISLNSTSKWKARVLPSLKEYYQKNRMLPSCITASFAFYIAFYRGTQLVQDKLAAIRPDGTEYFISDDKDVLEFYFNRRDYETTRLVHDVCTNTAFWGEDLSQLPEFEETLIRYLNIIDQQGSYELMKQCIENRG